MRSLGLALLTAMIAGCGGADSSPAAAPGAAPSAVAPQKVTLALNWYPEAEHGGYYAALVHGYFEEEGLEVEIQKGGPGAPVLQRVASGKVEFGVSNADGVLLARAQEADVVAVLAPIQTSPRCLLVHAESGIDSFDDLKDMTIGMSNTQPFFHYLRHKVPLTGVTIVPYPGNVANFLVDKNFAQQGYVFSEPFLAKQEGANPNVLLLADLGFNPYTSVLVASGETIRERQALVQAMVRACRRGWQKYLETPDETNGKIQALNPEMSLAVLEFGAKELAPMVRAGLASDQEIGAMTAERWRTLTEQLVECEQLQPDAVEPAEAFTTLFLK